MHELLASVLSIQTDHGLKYVFTCTFLDVLSFFEIMLLIQ